LSWRKTVSRYETTAIEHALETLTEDLKNLALFDLLALLANLAIIISLASFLTNGERQRHDEQVYNAWQVITNAYGQPGNGGRRRALEFLNSTPGTPGRRRWFGTPWPSESLQGVDVSKANLSRIRLPGADLKDANLQSANLKSADLRKTNLEYANLQEANLEAVNLQESDLEFANLRQVDLVDANLQQIALGAANLQGAYLRGVNLQMAFLTGVELKAASLHGANLQGTSLAAANLQWASFREANLQEANLSGALLLATDMRDSLNLRSSQLTKSDSIFGVPLVCNAALPKHIKDVDPNRDCDAISQALVKHYEWMAMNLSKEFQPITIEEAQAIVEKARQETWDD
jgi:uncharacterized protein YjbI with pentapeptide repeats